MQQVKFCLMLALCLMSLSYLNAKKSDDNCSDQNKNTGMMMSDHDNTAMMSSDHENTAMMTSEMSSDHQDNENTAEMTMPMGGMTPPPATPSSLLTTFVVDIHYLAGKPGVQFLAFHYCSALSPDYIQCAVYNGTDNNSRLAATELIVSEAVFKTFPLEERELWHSHAFAIKNGLFVIPGLAADQAESTLMALMSTYGKVTDFFHSTENAPLGPAQIAYGITEANQINATVADQLDKALNLSTTWEQRQAMMANWTSPMVVEGADGYMPNDMYPQYVVELFNKTSSR